MRREAVIMKDSTKWNGKARWTRVTRKVAKKMWEDGKAVKVCPVNMRVNDAWKWSLWATVSKPGECEFEAFVNEFEYYNCNNETGRYAKFFVEEI